jgi:hypothetical protein
VIATLHRQHGHALELAERGRAHFGDPIFDALVADSLAHTVRFADRALPSVVKKGIQVLRNLKLRA